jgi:hypothetical protein
MIDAGNIVRATDTTGIVSINQIHPIFVTFALPADSQAIGSCSSRLLGAHPASRFHRCC